MQKQKRAKLVEVVLGASGTIIVALCIMLARVPLSPSEILMAGEKPWVLFLVISSIFFFPPYFAALGLLALYTPETKEGEEAPRGIMSSYDDMEKSKKAWVKHLAACLVGVLNASLMWILIGTYQG